MFPSLTDTFGLVILEALACGTPVAAFPVTGPKDVLVDADGKIGAVNTDLRVAALAGADRRPGGLPEPCGALFVAGVRRDVPVAPGAADGRPLERFQADYDNQHAPALCFVSNRVSQTVPVSLQPL